MPLSLKCHMEARFPKLKSSLLATLIVVTAAGPSARAGVVATVFRIEDNRSMDFANDHVSRMPMETKIVLSLHGPEADSSTRYGNLKLEEAVDDLGTSLIPAKDSFNDPAKFKDYANSFFRSSKFGNQSAPADPQAEISLGRPKRAATKIARLRGSLTLSDQGTIQTVELPHLTGAGTKTLPIPADAHVSVTATVKDGDARSIGIEISGDEAALESVEIMDASGHKLSNGMSSWSVNGGPAHKSLGLDKPLDDSMKLVAKVALNRKLTTVPFDLKDIPLP